MNRSLIKLEAETLTELRQAVYDNIDTAVNLIGLSPANRKAAVDILQHIALNIQSEHTRIILSAREQSARLAFAEVTISADLTAADEVDEGDDDIARATSSAMSYAAALLLALLAANILKRKDLRFVAKSQDYRLSRIAATEIYQAYGQASERAYARIPKPERTQFEKRWDATLDMKVCQVCKSHHGEQVSLDADFRNGDVPGEVHPNCRCVSTLVSAAKSRAA